jgi:FkbH-like protein
LRTQRYTEGEIAEIAASDRYVTLCASLRDSFGDYGIIGAVILKEETEKTLFLDTFLMSCRVAKRGVEQFLFNAIACEAVRSGYREILAEYLPTAKNGPVRDLLKEMGFAYVGEASGGIGTVWKAEVDGYTPVGTFVRETLE